MFRCEFDDFDGNPTQFTPLNTTIVQSFFYYSCAKLLLLLLCRASTTTVVQSFYFYSCAEREGTVSPIISR